MPDNNMTDANGEPLNVGDRVAWFPTFAGDPGFGTVVGFQPAIERDRPPEPGELTHDDTVHVADDPSARPRDPMRRQFRPDMLERIG